VKKKAFLFQVFLWVILVNITFINADDTPTPTRTPTRTPCIKEYDVDVLDDNTAVRTYWVNTPPPFYYSMPAGIHGYLVGSSYRSPTPTITPYFRDGFMGYSEVENYYEMRACTCIKSGTPWGEAGWSPTFYKTEISNTEVFVMYDVWNSQPVWGLLKKVGGTSSAPDLEGAYIYVGGGEPFIVKWFLNLTLDDETHTATVRSGKWLQFYPASYYESDSDPTYVKLDKGSSEDDTYLK